MVPPGAGLVAAPPPGPAQAEGEAGAGDEAGRVLAGEADQAGGPGGGEPDRGGAGRAGLRGPGGNGRVAERDAQVPVVASGVIVAAAAVERVVVAAAACMRGGREGDVAAQGVAGYRHHGAPALKDMIGVLQLVTLIVAYRRQKITEADSAHDRTRVFNERFTAIAAHLGDAQPAVRLAGVQPLTRQAAELRRKAGVRRVGDPGVDRGRLAVSFDQVSPLVIQLVRWCV